MRAQVQNQVFVYMMAAVIMGLVVYFGAKGVWMMTKTSNDAAILKIEREVSDIISRLNYGEEREYSLNAPSGYELCFISSPSSNQKYSLLSEAFKEQGSGAYLVDIKSRVPKRISSIERPLEVAAGLICFSTSQSLRFSYDGRIVSVSK
ncbi:MAG: hypothetical protein QXW00_02005 [Candidatus Woesearchaeota archaeon]